jgi:hypothetical protein
MDFDPVLRACDCVWAAFGGSIARKFRGAELPAMFWLSTHGTLVQSRNGVNETIFSVKNLAHCCDGVT